MPGRSGAESALRLDAVTGWLASGAGLDRASAVAPWDPDPPALPSRPDGLPVRRAGPVTGGGHGDRCGCSHDRRMPTHPCAAQMYPITLPQARQLGAEIYLLPVFTLGADVPGVQVVVRQ
jgi:hypothetical protein